MFVQNIEKDYGKAASLFEEALDLDANHVNTLYNYGILLLKHIHDIDRTKEMFDRVLAIDANHVPTLSNYDLLLMEHSHDIDGDVQET